MRILIPLFALLSFSCVDQVVRDLDGDVNPVYGNTPFTNFESEEIRVTLLTNHKEPLRKHPVTLWNRHPGEGGHIVLKGLTDGSGTFRSASNLPNTITEVILEIDFIGMPNFLIIPRDELSDVFVQGTKHNYQERTVDIGAGKNTDQGRTALAPIQALGTYDTNGVPDYLEPTADVVSADLLTLINTSLPEGQPVPTYHPRFIAEDAEPNLLVTEEADVWMTFVHEGAGYRNVLGYYTYATGTPPEIDDDIDVLNIVFPNASYAGSGGGLSTGDKVYLGKFDPGTTIGFVLLANGWNGTEPTPGIHQVYSNRALNPESTPEMQAHSVLLYDADSEVLLVGFEDLNRDGNSDDDFNDAVFYLTANPIEAIDLTNVLPVDQPVDQDGDGVNDTYDDFPTDPELAYLYGYPSTSTYGSFAFEDQWPNTGDYDFNDLVADYQYLMYANGVNEIVKMDAQFVIQAVGAGFKNGFGFQLELPPSRVTSVTGQELSGVGVYTFNANGTEAGQSKATIIVSDDVHQDFDSYGFINTDEGLPYQTPDTATVRVTFSSAISSADDFDAPFNPFIVVNRQRGREIHIPGYEPTDLVDAALFGSGNDDSDPGLGIYYKTKVDLPWGMNLPNRFTYPVEKKDIRQGYNHFDDWARSSGFTYMDWYTDQSGYRTPEFLYE